jgi:hypothetical protein
MTMILCLGGRNVHDTVSGRKQCTCYYVWEEEMYMLLCLGGRNVHVTVSGRKECTCYCVGEEGMYMILCLGGRNVHYEWEEEMYNSLPSASGRKECIILLLRQGERNVHVVTMSGSKIYTCHCVCFCATVTNSMRMSRVL